MKRWLFKLVLFLLLGAAINVTFCCIVATRRIPFNFNPSEYYKVGHSDLEKHGHWDTTLYRSFGRVVLTSFWVYEWSGSYTYRLSSPPAHELVPDWARAIDNIKPSEINHAQVYAEATGWPFIAMLAHYERGTSFKDSTGKYIHAHLNENGIVISGKYDNRVQILPFTPLWPGFAINTIFFAAILWLLTLGPFTARRIIRRKRGHCIKCGYDLRGTSGGCPECGWGREAEA